MTTIVYRDGVLAGDTRATENDIICPGRYRKVFKLKDGSLFGYAGDLAGAQILKSAVEGNYAPKVGDTKDVEGVHVRTDGSVWVYEGRMWLRDRAPYVVLGTGYIAALGALKIGADAVTACRAACEVDVHSAKPVQLVSLRNSVVKPIRGARNPHERRRNAD